MKRYFYLLCSWQPYILCLRFDVSEVWCVRGLMCLGFDVSGVWRVWGCEWHHFKYLSFWTTNKESMNLISIFRYFLLKRFNQLCKQDEGCLKIALTWILFVSMKFTVTLFLYTQLAIMLNWHKKYSPWREFKKY